MAVMNLSFVDGEFAGRIRALASPASAYRAGRFAAEGDVVAFAEAVDPVQRAAATHVVFHASDGYAVSLEMAEAVSDALLVLPPPGSGKTGVRLVVAGSRSKCFNVKAVTSMELRISPGRHTVNPEPHRNPRVTGWDV